MVKGNYYALIEVKTESGTIINDTIHFSVNVEKEKEQYLNVEDTCNGNIEVTAYPNIITGVGTSNPTPPIYIKHEKVKLVSCVNDFLRNETFCNWVKWTNIGLDIPINFVLRGWFSPSRVSSRIIRIYSVSNSDYIDVFFERGQNEDYIKVVTNNGTSVSASFGNIVTMNDSCFLWVKHVSGYWDVRAERLSQGLPMLVSWNNGSNIEYNTTSDIKYGSEDYGLYVPSTPSQTQLQRNMDSMIITNGIFDHIEINKNTNLPYSTDIPEESTSGTIMNCNFKDNLSCSDFVADKIIIYHREVNTNEWIKLLERNLTAGYNNISFNDVVVKANVELEYMAEYIANGIVVNTKYETITPRFNKVFITDPERTFKFDANVIYSNNSQNIQVGTLLPLGSKYPIIIQNSKNNYKSGNISLTVMGSNFDENHIIVREEMRRQSEEILDFLTNKKTKIFKDWNGNIFIFGISGNVNVNYDSSYGNGIITINFDWVEQADYHDLDTLREFGFYL